uniref:F-box domain-containing protein n=1 Tax=Ciona savignyi TaxID=51511 RepID=H2ZN90_CIOSA
MKLCLISLPDEVLIYIFSFLDIVSLVKVSLVCKKLKSIASSNAVWLPHNLNVLNKALLSGIPVKEQCRISHRWRKGLGYSLKLQSYPRSFMPWMDISQRKLFMSQGDMVQKFELKSELNFSNRLKRLGKSAIKFEKTYVPQRGDDVYQFCVRRNLLVCGGWNGYLSWTDLNSDSTNINKNSHESDVHAVDFRDNIIVSGSRKEDIKVWRFNADYSHISECTSINTMDRILSLRINPTLSTFVSGTGGILAHPLRVWDLNRGEFVHQLGKNHRLGGGPLDMAFTGAHTLLSAGYDTYIKLWDTRKSTSHCVRSWEEPHDNTIYCLTTDGGHMIVSGSCRHGVVRLWDARMHKCLQTFYFGGRHVNSPVYSVQSTRTHLFAALAKGLFAIEFT